MKIFVLQRQQLNRFVLYSNVCRVKGQVLHLHATLSVLVLTRSRISVLTPLHLTNFLKWIAKNDFSVIIWSENLMK